MARRQLTLEEIEDYRAVQRDQLRRHLLAGEDTRTVRRSLAELDDQEVSARNLREQTRAADLAASIERAKEITAAAAERVAAVFSGLTAPEMPQ